MNKNDIPQELQDKIRRVYDAQPEIIEMRKRQRAKELNNDYIGAMGIAKEIEEGFNRAIVEYLEQAEKQVDKVGIGAMDMKREDKDELLSLIITMFMCGDIIESAIQDADRVLHRYDKNLSFEMFNDFKQMMSLSKAKLDFLRNSSDFLQDMVFADKCDDMYEMMFNKAKKVLRKKIDQQLNK